jgi:hypothetical protein
MKIETHRATQAPLPEQMFKMARIIGGISKRQQVIIRNTKKDRAHYFLPQIAENYAVFPDNGIGEEAWRYTGRIARTGFREWSLFMANPYHSLVAKRVEKPDSYDPEIILVQDGFRATYAFCWDNNRVIRAEKRIVAVDPMTKDPRLVAEIPEDDIPDELSVEHLVIRNALRSMNRGDCDRLIEDLCKFHSSALTDDQV